MSTINYINALLRESPAQAWVDGTVSPAATMPEKYVRRTLSQARVGDVFYVNPYVIEVDGFGETWIEVTHGVWDPGYGKSIYWWSETPHETCPIKATKLRKGWRIELPPKRPYQNHRWQLRKLYTSKFSTARYEPVVEIVELPSRHHLVD